MAWNDWYVSMALKCLRCWQSFELFAVLAKLWHVRGVGTYRFWGHSCRARFGSGIELPFSAKLTGVWQLLIHSFVQSLSNPSWSLRSWQKSWWTRRSSSQSVLMWYPRTMGTRFTLPWRLRRTMSTLSLRLFASVFLAVILELTSLERSNSRNAYVRWVLRDGPVTTSFQFFVKQDLGDLHLSSNLVCCSPLPRESVGVYQSMQRILILCASCSAISHST